MTPAVLRIGVCIVLSMVIAACATRPVNPPLAKLDYAAGYRFETRERYMRDGQDLVILAFSGGGTRAAAFSYGVLEALKGLTVRDGDGREVRLLDYVDVITGVSGGSFTALAYGLYGDRLFAEYEARFLKRDVEGELLHRLISPGNWGSLWSKGWGRSELAAELYDEILFEGATFADLQRGKGPLIVVTATDLSTGARVYFLQSMYDAMCSDLAQVRLSRAAAASSAVPVVLSPVTIDNHGGTCGYTEPPLLRPMLEAKDRARPAARAIVRARELAAYGDSTRRPYVHLVDGGVSDNVAMRGVLETMDDLEALHMLGRRTPLDDVKRIVVFVVNSLSTPSTHWDESVDAPNTFDVLLRAASVPIDHYSFEAIELLRDMASRWRDLRTIRDSVTIRDGTSPSMTMMTRVPDAEIYVIDVSFPALADKAEVAYLNSLPTSFALPPEAVDRLRSAARTIVLQSPELARFLRDRGERIVDAPVAGQVEMRRRHRGPGLFAGDECIPRSTESCRNRMQVEAGVTRRRVTRAVLRSTPDAARALRGSAD